MTQQNQPVTNSPPPEQAPRPPLVLEGCPWSTVWILLFAWMVSIGVLLAEILTNPVPTKADYEYTKMRAQHAEDLLVERHKDLTCWLHRRADGRYSLDCYTKNGKTKFHVSIAFDPDCEVPQKMLNGAELVVGFAPPSN